MKHHLFAGVTAALLAAAGCGGGSGGGNGAPPTATLTAPAALADGLAGTITLAATAAGAAVASVEFEVDGIAAGSDPTAPYEVSLDTTAFASGQHVVRARAVDAQGRAGAWSAATVRFGGSRTLPAGFAMDPSFVTALDRATAFVQTPDGRWLIAEQGGTVRVLKDGQLLLTPFLELADVDASGERGLIGIAVDPNFAVNRHVYLHYTTLVAAPVGGVHNRIVRVTADNDRMSAGSEVTVLELPALSTATNHNGGALHFGADGKLYAGVGDNADGARAQDLGSPFGKLLRLNADGTIPADNPYVGVAGADPAVWATGLRNPFTFAVQPGTGRIHVNDVGAERWEEIDVGTAGANYGWPASEGPDNVGAGVTAPLFAYGHDAAVPPGSGPGGFFTGASIAGGVFYPSAGAFPAAYRGNYYFADFIGRFVARMDLANDADVHAFAQVADMPVDLRVGLDGALYVLGRSSVTRIAAVP
jgi:glucose/arabinose dehydrogenase